MSVLLDPYTEWTWFTRTALSVCREPLPSSKDRPSVPFTLVCIYPLRTGSMPPLPGVARTDPVYPVETGYLEATEDTYMQCFIAGEPVVKVLQDTRYLPLGSYRYYLVRLRFLILDPGNPLGAYLAISIPLSGLPPNNSPITIPVNARNCLETLFKPAIRYSQGSESRCQRFSLPDCKRRQTPEK